MNRQEKELVIESLRADFGKSQATFLVGVKGLTVSQLQQLRRNLGAKNGKMRLAKNTLTKIVSEEIPGMSELAPYLKNQIAIVFAMGESPAVAKVLWDIAQENEKVALVIGSFESRIIDKEMIKFLALLPARPILAAQLCAAVQAPLVHHVRLLHRVVVSLLWVLNKAQESK